MTDQINELKEKVNNLPPEQAKNIALGAAAISVVSVFFPWLASSATIMGHSASMSLAGYLIAGGQLGLLISLGAAYGVTKDKPYVLYLALANILIALGYVFGMFTGVSYSGPGGSVSIDAKIGVYIFLLSSIVLAGIRFLRSQKTGS